tara:strand:- start:392 stop:535 length:144 start_codon:yes stop_codon:yes gene_type:complete
MGKQIKSSIIAQIGPITRLKLDKNIIFAANLIDNLSQDKIIGKKRVM